MFTKGRNRVIETVAISLWLLVAGCFINAHADLQEPLRVDQAFQFSTEVVNPQQITAHFKITPEYFLYKNRFHFSTEPSSKLEIQYPKAEVKRDIDGKRKEFYSGDIAIPITIADKLNTTKLIVEYQGCAKSGLCYPPQKREVLLNLTTTHVQDSGKSFSWLQALLTNQYGISELLYTQQVGVIILLFIGLGLLLSLTPCVLPMVPILTSIIVGQKQNTSTKRAFLLSSTYVFGMAITYAVAGVFAALLGNSLQVWLQKPFIIILVSLLFGLLALSLFGLYHLQLPRFMQNYLHRLNHKTIGGSYPSVFAMGVLSTLVVSPCVTAPLVGVLMYIGQTGNIFFGASALFALGIGMGIPLLVIGISAGKWFPKTGAWMEVIKKAFGFVMLGMCIWMLSRILAPSIIMLLWGLLLVSMAIYFLFAIRTPSKTRLLFHGMSGLVGFAGMLLVFGAIGLSTPVKTLATESPTLNTQQHFIAVNNLDDFQKQMSVAHANNKPVILDFYADWCESCVTMDRKVFNLPHVQTQLADYTLLRADLSASSEAADAILKYFKVIAPPTILFFDNTGKEIDKKRIVGEVDANEFLMRLNNKS